MTTNDPLKPKPLRGSAEPRLASMSKLIVLPTAIVLMLGGCLLRDAFDASYDSMADAISDEAVSKGWIPEWVPESAQSPGST